MNKISTLFPSLKKALQQFLWARGETSAEREKGRSYRIVVAYDVPSLTLLAIRHMRTGAYMPHSEVELNAAKHGVSMARSFGSVEDVKSFWNDARA